MNDRCFDADTLVEFDTSDVGDDTIEMVGNDQRWSEEVEFDISDTIRIEPTDTVEMPRPEMFDSTVETAPSKEGIVSGEIVCRAPKPPRHHASVTSSGLYDPLPADPMPNPQTDRRRQRRYPVQRRVQFRVPPYPVSSTAKVCDLSRTGMFVQTARTIFPGNFISGTFRADTGDRRNLLHFTGEVVWKTNPDRHPITSRAGFAVRFCCMRKEDLSRIDRLLQRYDRG